MSDLTDFLLARIAEDETCAALATRGVTMGRWTINPGEASADDVHIARHDPARVLAECEARRRVVELANNETWSDPAWDHALDAVFTLLALPYADHSDYREGWKP